MSINCHVKGCSWTGHFILEHLDKEHEMVPEKYSGPLMSEKLSTRFAERSEKMRRKGAPDLDKLKVDFAGLQFPINWDVPVEDCLPLPSQWYFPKYSPLARDIREATISLLRNRSMYIWGMPGSGKDALFHAYSFLTRTPGALFSIMPDTDVQSWFFSRSFDQSGTSWEEGLLLKALRDGYMTRSGRRIPYLVLITDFDRANPNQSEILRLCLDTIKKRVPGPQGKVYDIFPGTSIVVTANTAGSGDERGRFVSAKPIDASIMDRFERGYEFHWMDWRDEEIICRAKFPLLASRCPNAFSSVGKATEKLRAAIHSGDLYAEFSHRAVCSWLEHAEDILVAEYPLPTDSMPANLIARAARCWVDLMPDREQSLNARRLIDGVIPGGSLLGDDTDHMNLDEEWT